MKNLYKILGIIAIGAVIVAVSTLAGCDNGSTDGGSNNNNSSGGIAGTWGGMVGGYNTTVVIDASGWSSSSSSGVSDNGTYTLSGITFTLYSLSYRTNIGIGVLIDSNTFSVTFNNNSLSNVYPPGTYTLTRR
jgi:hypothetical protein